MPSRGPATSATQAFARRLGATWAGGSDETPPEPLDAAIIYATVGDLVPLALRRSRKGGRVVCAGIHMSDIPAFPYRLLWEERQLVSVANLTRQDGIEFLRLRPEIGIVTETTPYPLTEANERSPIFVRVGSRAPQFLFPNRFATTIARRSLPPACALEDPLTSRPDGDFHDAVTLMPEELVGLDDSVERERVGDEIPEGKPLGPHDAHEPAHPLFAPGT